jgi:hypothetical protein
MISLGTNLRPQCAHCLQYARKLLYCGKCGVVRYCNKDHQVRDWSRHKLFLLSYETTIILTLSSYTHNEQLYSFLFYINIISVCLVLVLPCSFCV